MFLTKECDYGVRIIRALSDGGKKTVDKISVAEQIPQKYAYKIVNKMVQSGLVNSTRGRVGGYHLNKALDSITLLDIIKAVDANRYVNECLHPDASCHFKGKSEQPCKVHAELERIQMMIVSELNAKTMDEVLQV